MFVLAESLPPRCKKGIRVVRSWASSRLLTAKLTIWDIYTHPKASVGIFLRLRNQQRASTVAVVARRSE